MREPGEFGVTVVSETTERAVVRVTGDLDMATADNFTRSLEDIEPSIRLVIDLSECTFLDSAGVRVITSTLRDDRRVSLVVADPGIRRILEITALDTRAEILSSADAV